MTITSADFYEVTARWPNSTDRVFNAGTRTKHVPYKKGRDLEPLPYYRVLRVGREFSDWGFNPPNQYVSVNANLNAVSEPPEAELINKSISDSSVLQYYYNKAYARFTEHARQAEVDLMAMIGERKRTAAMVSGRILQLTNIVDSLTRDAAYVFDSFYQDKPRKPALRKRRSKVARSLKKAFGFPPDHPGNRMINTTLQKPGVLSTPAALWLELNWGWKPMLDDIQGLVELMAEPIPPVRVTGKYQVPVTRPFSKRFGSLKRWYWSSTIPDGKFLIRIQVQLIQSSRIKDSFTSLGLTNIFQSAYELTPWSWLFDYGTSLGSFISGLDDGLEFSYKHGQVMRLLKYSEVAETVWPGYHPKGWSLTRDVVAMRRETRPLGLHSPYLTWEREPFSWKRAANLTAVLVLKWKALHELGRIAPNKSVLPLL